MCEVDMSLSDILGTDSVWTPRFNGMCRNAVSGREIASQIDSDTFLVTCCEFVFKDKKDKRIDYSFNFVRNGLAGERPTTLRT
jgi:hypothetical protein